MLEQELNSDLPGMIRALVRENVYDSVTGQYLLIPAGSTLIGMYNSHVDYGQDALQAVWNRIIFPGWEFAATWAHSKATTARVQPDTGIRWIVIGLDFFPVRC